MTVIDKIMMVLSEVYQGRFKVTENTATVWGSLLADIDEWILESAVLHLVSTKPEWPPDVAQIRSMSVLMSQRKLALPAGEASWERIRMKMAGKNIELDAFEKKALAQTDKIYDLQRSTNPAADRARYIKAYDAIVSGDHLERVTLPVVKKLITNEDEMLVCNYTGVFEEKYQCPQ